MENKNMIPFKQRLHQTVCRKTLKL